MICQLDLELIYLLPDLSRKARKDMITGLRIRRYVGLVKTFSGEFTKVFEELLPDVPLAYSYSVRY
jgi:hypothetical protein